MFRLFMVLAIAGLLIGCTGQGNGGSDASADAGSSIDAAASADASAGASGGATGTASASCGEAFGPLAEMGITSVSELGDLQAEVEPTIEGCESIADWIAGAADVVEDDVNPNTARMLLGIFCNDPTLSGTAVCEELASS